LWITKTLNNYILLKSVFFCDSNGIPLNTVVIIGNNGTEKTTLLKSLFEFFEVDYKGYNPTNLLEIELHPDIIGVNSNKDDPKVIYMSAEIRIITNNKYLNGLRYLLFF